MPGDRHASPRTAARRSARPARRGFGPGSGCRRRTAAAWSMPSTGASSSQRRTCRRSRRHRARSRRRASPPRPRRHPRGRRLRRASTARPRRAGGRNAHDGGWAARASPIFAIADLVDYRVDDIEDRRRRAEAGVDRQVAELERELRPRPLRRPPRAAPRTARSPIRRARSNSCGSVPWKPKIACLKSPTMNRVRMPALGLARPAEIFARPAPGRSPIGRGWCPALRRPGYGRCAGRACSAPIRPFPASQAAAGSRRSGRRNRRRRRCAWPGCRPRRRPAQHASPPPCPTRACSVLDVQQFGHRVASRSA